MKTAATIAALIVTASTIFAGEAREKEKFPDQNLGTTDRIIRTTIGAGLATAGTIMIVRDDNSKGAIPLGISAVPLLTAAFGRCPLYYPFGFSTKRKATPDVSVIVAPQGTSELRYSLYF